LPYWKHDANTHISLLFQNIREEVKIHGRPKVLYLQFDNCCKDNKNKFVMLEIFLQFRYLFSFLSLLVKHQWFREIIIIYLPVGHTHEKVDRDLFATIGNLKSLKDCQIPDQFPKFALKSFRKCPNKPQFRKDPTFWDWKEYLADNIRSIKNLSGFRAFLIKLNNLDQPELFFQKSILDLTWLGFEGSLNQGMPISLLFII
jgi:hypothetical protein